MQEFLRVNETVSELCGRCSNTSAFNCSEGAMLACVLGPRRLPLALVLPVTALFVAIFLTGVVGNAMVCAVVAIHPSIHTDTDYYLFSLAISHLLLLVFGLPSDLSMYWHQYPYSFGIVFCKLRAFIYEAASYVSVLTIVTLTLKWYLAICHPLHTHVMAGLRRTTYIVLVLWAVALLAVSPFALYTTINYHEYPPGSGNISLESASCGMLDLLSWHICELSSFFFFFLLPGVIILYLYVRMGLNVRATLKRLNTPVAFVYYNNPAPGELQQAYFHRDVIRMLAAVAVAFFVSWALIHVQRLFHIYGVGSEHYHAVNERLYLVAGACYYVSATVNPILYKIMSFRYKLAYKDILRLCRRVPPRRSSYSEIADVRETIINRPSPGFSLMRVRGSDFCDYPPGFCAPEAGIQGALYETRALRDPRRERDNINDHRYTFEET